MGFKIEGRRLPCRFRAARQLALLIVVLTTPRPFAFCATSDPSSLPRATIAMAEIQAALNSVIAKISDQNYDESFAFYRFWFEIAQTYSQILPDQIFDDIRKNRWSTAIDSRYAKLIHPTVHLIFRFANDAESDPILGPHSVRLHSRLRPKVLQEFFENSVKVARERERGFSEDAGYWFPADVNFIAHWANLGYVEEATIRNHILQSLICHSKLYEHQADALIVLFKLAGATFAKYADPTVIDRCFELLKVHYGGNSARGNLVRVRVTLLGEMLSLG